MNKRDKLVELIEKLYPGKYSIRFWKNKYTVKNKETGEVEFIITKAEDISIEFTGENIKPNAELAMKIHSILKDEEELNDTSK